MNPLREFLEASNLHGLVHISKAESKWGKILWTVSVVISFSAAGVLINRSYAGWKDQPVSSVISTHPIKNLKFPNVTVCPPKGTNTALNYDLLNLANVFTTSQKDALSKEIKGAFFDQETQTYTRALSEITNEANLINIYKGFQTLPNQRQTGYTVRLSGQKGEISVNASENYDSIHYILELPDNLEQIVGESGMFVVTVTLDLEGSMLEYLIGPKFLGPPQ